MLNGDRAVLISSQPVLTIIKRGYDEALGVELKRSFLMSYMRSLEGTLSGHNDVGGRIPFYVCREA
jgi:hypothetical protein